MLGATKWQSEKNQHCSHADSGCKPCQTLNGRGKFLNKHPLLQKCGRKQILLLCVYFYQKIIVFYLRYSYGPGDTSYKRIFP